MEVSLATHVFSLVVGGALLIQQSELIVPLKLGTFLALLNLIKSSGENYQSLSDNLQFDTLKKSS